MDWTQLQLQLQAARRICMHMPHISRRAASSMQLHATPSISVDACAWRDAARNFALHSRRRSAQLLVKVLKQNSAYTAWHEARIAAHVAMAQGAQLASVQLLLPLIMTRARGIERKPRPGTLTTCDCMRVRKCCCRPSLTRIPQIPRFYGAFARGQEYMLVGRSSVRPCVVASQAWQRRLSSSSPTRSR
jgi:hypothetical protein